MSSARLSSVSMYSHAAIGDEACCWEGVGETDELNGCMEVDVECWLLIVVASTDVVKVVLLLVCSCSLNFSGANLSFGAYRKSLSLTGSGCLQGVVKSTIK